jgi:hypothetical protein
VVATARFVTPLRRRASALRRDRGWRRAQVWVQAHQAARDEGSCGNRVRVENGVGVIDRSM